MEYGPHPLVQAETLVSGSGIFIATCPRARAIRFGASLRHGSWTSQFRFPQFGCAAVITWKPFRVRTFRLGRA